MMTSAAPNGSVGGCANKTQHVRKPDYVNRNVSTPRHTSFNNVLSIVSGQDAW